MTTRADTTTPFHLKLRPILEIIVSEMLFSRGHFEQRFTGISNISEQIYFVDRFEANTSIAENHFCLGITEANNK